MRMIINCDKIKDEKALSLLNKIVKLIESEKTGQFVSVKVGCEKSK